MLTIIRLLRSVRSLTHAIWCLSLTVRVFNEDLRRKARIKVPISLEEGINCWEDYLRARDRGEDLDADLEVHYDPPTNANSNNNPAA